MTESLITQADRELLDEEVRLFHQMMHQAHPEGYNFTASNAPECCIYIDIHHDPIRNEHIEYRIGPSQEQLITRPTCETCRFWARTTVTIGCTADGGECRRFPPKKTTGPTTHELYWCGEHQPKTTTINQVDDERLR